MAKFNILVIVLLISVLSTFGQKSAESICDDSPKFRYVIVDNWVSKEKKKFDRSREMLVFFDEKSFSEENLKNLFMNLSKKYKVPQTLTVRVETLWDRIPTPDECASGMSGMPDDNEEGHWAVFMRRGDDEIFRYNPDKNKTGIKTIVLKGLNFP